MSVPPPECKRNRRQYAFEVEWDDDLNVPVLLKSKRAFKLKHKKKPYTSAALYSLSQQCQPQIPVRSNTIHFYSSPTIPSNDLITYKSTQFVFNIL